MPSRPTSHNQSTMPARQAGATTPKRRPGSTLDQDVITELRELHELGRTGKSIARHLEKRFGARAPHLNTVYAVQRDLKRDESAAWSVADDSFHATAARAVLEELRDVVKVSHGNVRSFTQLEARWIARLRAIFPEMPRSGTAYLEARLRIEAEDHGEPLTPIDLDRIGPDPHWPMPPAFADAAGGTGIAHDATVLVK